MKNILVVVENEVDAKSMLEKAMTFSPENIEVVVSGEGSTANIEATLHEVTNKQCKAKMITNFDDILSSLSENMSQVVNQLKPEMVVVHRPKVGSAKQEYDMVKAVLKSAGQSTVLLCGNNKWKSKMKIMATLDMVDDSSPQKLLNAKVLDVAVEVQKRTLAELTLLSVLEITRFRDELDIAVPSDLMATKGKVIKTKLKEMIKTTGEPIAFLTYVCIGVPSKEISLVSKKLKSDFVIIGNVGRTGIKGLIVGNTAEKILDKVSVDTLIVKT